MKATGEVMAIERNFGAALNKALRGLEQAGAGWLSEQPEWAPDLDALAADTAHSSNSAIHGVPAPPALNPPEHKTSLPPYSPGTGWPGSWGRRTPAVAGDRAAPAGVPARR